MNSWLWEDQDLPTFPVCTTILTALTFSSHISLCLSSFIFRCSNKFQYRPCCIISKLFDAREVLKLATNGRLLTRKFPLSSERVHRITGHQSRDLQTNGIQFWNIPPRVSGAEDRISCNISLLWYILLEEKPLIDIFQCLDFQHVWKLFLEFVGLKWSSASDLRYEKDLHDGNYLNKVNIEGRDIVRKSFLSWLIVDMMSVLHIVCLFSGEIQLLRVTNQNYARSILFISSVRDEVQVGFYHFSSNLKMTKWELRGSVQRSPDARGKGAGLGLVDSFGLKWIISRQWTDTNLPFSPLPLQLFLLGIIRVYPRLDLS